LQEFTQICNLLYNNYEYDESEDGKSFNFVDVVDYFLTNPTSIILTPFNVGLIRLNIQVYLYVVNHVLFLRKSNSSHINKYDKPLDLCNDLSYDGEQKQEQVSTIQRTSHKNPSVDRLRSREGGI
ncbi:hypothetical protein RYX36_029095, partial [Vicia faba]